MSRNIIKISPPINPNDRIYDLINGRYLNRYEMAIFKIRNRVSIRFYILGVRNLGTLCGLSRYYLAAIQILRNFVMQRRNIAFQLVKKGVPSSLDVRALRKWDRTISRWEAWDRAYQILTRYEVCQKGRQAHANI